ncbi:CDP-alcohol phosphatidyltransferase family protein [Clostridiaceae bacterium M8S5]|nr:CDP-alcohol phosphatidyltransferase family protein [Clostridiaceae bacterium M8S5]
MNKKILANCITIIRIPLALFLFFIRPFSMPFYIIYLICGLSDMFDGYIARKTCTESIIGEKLDSVADFIMFTVVFIIFSPIILITNVIIIWIITIFIVRLVLIIIAYIKYKKLMAHSRLNKFTGLLLFSFPIVYIYTQSNLVIYILCIIASISTVDELVKQIHSTS